ncbi:hypothetical protein K8I31_07680 [bacterium]|nr:hypothetical protein [bacterium]
MVRSSIIALLVLPFLFINANASESITPSAQSFHWTFESGKVPQSWRIAETNSTKTLAQWNVVEDKADGNHWFAITKTENKKRTYNLAIFEEAKFKDVRIQVVVKAETGVEDQGGGPIWRAIDENNYYVARWNPLEDNFRVYYVKDSVRKQLASLVVKLDPKKPHIIFISMVGTTINAMVDDHLLTLEDNTFTKAGKIGLWTKADAATWFDDLLAEPK